MDKNHEGILYFELGTCLDKINSFKIYILALLSDN